MVALRGDNRAVTPEDFFKDGGLMGRGILDRGLIERIRLSRYVDRSDAEVCGALLRLAHNELEAYGTGGGQRTDEDEIRLILRTCRALSERIGLSLDLPFSDFQTFESHWKANGAYGSWQARRDILNNLFEPVHLELTRLEENEIVSTLARPITRSR